MAQNAKDDWQELCRAASTEKDPEKLLRLVTRINSLLLKKEKKVEPGQKTDAEFEPKENIA